jgi:small subunit ribosomal protein S15
MLCPSTVGTGWARIIQLTYALVLGGRLNPGLHENQAVNLTLRINQVTSHLLKNPNDAVSKRGLLKLVARRRRVLLYLERFPERHRAAIMKLGLV